MKKLITELSIFMSIVLLTACSTVGTPVLSDVAETTPHHTVTSSSSNAKRFTQVGQASFYANLLENRQTANGERFKQHLITAAHRTLPFGTRVKVTNRVNGKSVTVRINDRGPYIRGRIIDLSRAAFRRISPLSKGVIPVKIEVVR